MKIDRETTTNQSNILLNSVHIEYTLFLFFVVVCFGFVLLFCLNALHTHIHEGSSSFIIAFESTNELFICMLNFTLSVCISVTYCTVLTSIGYGIYACNG